MNLFTSTPVTGLTTVPRDLFETTPLPLFREICHEIDTRIGRNTADRWRVSTSVGGLVAVKDGM